MRDADPGRAREAARSILREFGVSAPPVPVERIIKSRKIVLQYAPLEEDLSGMAYIKDGIGIIGVNALHHPNRQRFSAAMNSPIMCCTTKTSDKPFTSTRGYAFSSEMISQRSEPNR
ncbi:hypothetical protein BRDID11002_15780 [Bradyrhizobium diazoefficiens]